MEKRKDVLRQELVENVRNKIKNDEKLTVEEKEYINNVLIDPLDEFCKRESTFRLVEVLNIPVEQANKLTDKATESIRDTIDYSKSLYDEIDMHLRDDLGL